MADIRDEIRECLEAIADQKNNPHHHPTVDPILMCNAYFFKGGWTWKCSKKYDHAKYDKRHAHYTVTGRIIVEEGEDAGLDNRKATS